MAQSQHPMLATPETRKIARKEDVWHLITSGRLFEATYDLEVTDLHERFAGIMQFGGIISDVADNHFAVTELWGKTPKHVVEAPQAKLVTGTYPKKPKKADPPHIIAGKVAAYFNSAHDLSLADHLPGVEDVCDGYEVIMEDGKAEKILLYPLLRDDGTTEHVRIYSNLKTLGYQNDDGKWVKVPLHFTSSGHNAIRADDRWIQSALFQSMHRDSFVTHLLKHRATRVDTFSLARLVFAFGPKGEYGLRPGEVHDPVSGETLPSFKLSALMKANTRLEDPVRHVPEGVKMADGSLYDETQGHTALYDALAARGLKQYLRKIAPKLVKQAEIIWGHTREVVRALVDNPEGFGDYPLIGFARASLIQNKGINASRVQAHIGMAIGTDEAYGDRAKAVLLNLNIDPETYAFKQQKLLDMDVETLAAMMKEQRGSPDAVFEVINLRKNPLITDYQTAIEANAHHGIGLDRLDGRRRAVLAHPEFRERVMQAYQIVQPDPPKPDSEIVPQPEEEIYRAVGNFDYYAIKTPMGEFYATTLPDGKRAVIPLNIHSAAENKFNMARQIDNALKRIIEPDPVEWQRGHDTLKAFVSKLRKENAKLARYQIGVKHPIQIPYLSDINIKDADDPFTREDAIEYLWYLRKHFRKKFHDYTRHYVVQDKFGHDVPFDDVLKTLPIDRIEKLQTGEWHIEFERLNTSRQLIALMFINADRTDELGENWAKWYDDFCTLRIQGAPNQDPDKHRWMSANRALNEIQRLKNNLKLGSDLKPQADSEAGAFEIFVMQHPDGQKILAELEAFYEKRLKDHPWTDEAMDWMGFHPETRQPKEKIKFAIKPRKTMIIDVGDAFLDAAISHRDFGNRLIHAALGENFNHKAAKGAEILLRGTESGKIYHAAGARVLDAPPDRGAYAELWQSFRKAALDSALDEPEAGTGAMIACEGPYPLANIRAIDTGNQVLPLDKLNFLGTVSPALGFARDKIGGTIFRDDRLEVKTGGVRLQERENGELTGWELETKITKAKRVTMADIRGFNDAQARYYGFASRNDMTSKLMHAYADYAINANDNHHTFILVEWDAVDKASMAWFHPERTPTSALIAPLYGKSKSGDRWGAALVKS
jgi:exonuclease I